MTTSDFSYDDGGLDYDRGQTSMQYPETLGLSFLDNLNEAVENAKNVFV